MFNPTVLKAVGKGLLTAGTIVLPPILKMWNDKDAAAAAEKAMEAMCEQKVAEALAKAMEQK